MADQAFPQAGMGENRRFASGSATAWRGPAMRYGSALVCVALAFFATLLLAKFDTYPAQLFLFIPAVVASARLGGLGPGLVSVVLVVMLADYFFVPPIYDLLPTPESAPRMAAFLLCALIGGLIAFPRARANDTSVRSAEELPIPARPQHVETAQSADILRRAALAAAGDRLATVQPKKILIMGLAGAGKTTLANALAPRLNAVHLNGDEVRANIDKELGFSHEDRLEHARRMGWLCDRIVTTGTYAIADFICPTERTRAAFGDAFVVWIDRIKESRFPDTNAMFEAPHRFDVRVAAEGTPEYWAEQVVEKLVPTFDPQAPTALFIGRYQPFHDGHKALIEEGLRRVGQACIAVRDTHGTDEKNPFAFETVKQRIEIAMAPYRGRLLIVRLPNITNVYYGRDVGYTVERLVLDESTEQISATAIRNKMAGPG